MFQNIFRGVLFQLLVIWLIRCQICVLNCQTPLNCLLESYPKSHTFSTLDLKTFSCSTFVHNHDQNCSKLDPHSLKCIFLGYSTAQKGYQCYSSEKRKYFTSMDVMFFEDCPFYQKNLFKERVCEKIFFRKQILTI